MNLDFLKDIGTLLSRKDKKEEYIEEPDDEEVPQKKKEVETDVLSMKEGDYGTIYGIKKKYVKYLCYGIACLVGIAFFYNFGSKMGNDKSHNAAIRQESVANINDSKNQMSKEALDSLNTAVKNGQPLPGKKNQQNPNEVNVLKNQATNVDLPQFANVERQPGQYRTQQSLPYGNNYMLPSLLPNQQSAAATSTKEEDSVAKKLEDSFRSAIAFFNGSDGMANATNTGGGATAESSPSQAQPSFAYTSPSPYILQAGTCIPAMLISSINSDIEGIVSAQVINDIYDTATGYNLLIPAGSRLVGSYQAKETGGRVAVTFTELILPSGASYTINDSLIAIDSYGYVGLTGKVNHHTNAKLTAAGISAAIAAGTSAAFGNVNSNSNNYTVGQLAQQGAMASIMENVSDMFRQSMNQADTVTVQAGTPFNIFVSKGLVFNEY